MKGMENHLKECRAKSWSRLWLPTLVYMVEEMHKSSSTLLSCCNFHLGKEIPIKTKKGTFRFKNTMTHCSLPTLRMASIMQFQTKMENKFKTFYEIE